MRGDRRVRAGRFQCGTVLGVRWPDSADIPALPGSYTFRDEQGRALYVGKAADLRRRLGDYTAGRLHGLMAQVLAEAAEVSFVVTLSEAEALWVEASLIASLHPRYNLRVTQPDDLAYVAVTVGDPIPRVLTWRGAAPRGVRRFGPHPGSTRDLVELVGRLWGLRPCRDSVLAQHERAGRPCLLGETGRCAAPCINPEGYGERVTAAVAFLEGRTRDAERSLQQEMLAAASGHRYEQAALLRDRIELVRGYTRERTVADLPGDWAVLGAASDDLGAVVAVLHLTDGTVSGTETVVVDWPATGPIPDSTQVLASAWWRLAPPRPGRVLAATGVGATFEPEAGPARGESDSADAEPREPVRFVSASGAAQRRAVDVAAATAAAALVQRRRQATGDPATRAAGAVSLARALDLAAPPWRIECLDVSHFAGTGVVAGLSVLVDALPKPALYRRWRLPEGNDDYAAMGTAVARRVAHLAAPKTGPGKRRLDESLDQAPDLLVIDGGAGQLAAALRALADGGVHLPVIGLAKRLEEVYLPDRADPIVLDRDSPALLLLQRARDEAHRTAVDYQRAVRRRNPGAATDDARLHGITGLGPARRTRLLAEAGSVDALVGLSTEELRARHRWLPEPVARAIATALSTR